MEQLKYSLKIYVDNSQIKIKPCRMAATDSPTTAHLSPLPAVIERTIDRYTGTRVQKARHTRTHAEETPNSLHQK